jgi:hypothetical protein
MAKLGQKHLVVETPATEYDPSAWVLDSWFTVSSLQPGEGDILYKWPEILQATRFEYNGYGEKRIAQTRTYVLT